MKQKKRERLANLFNVLGERNHINAAVLVAEDGDIIYQNSFGYANLPEKRLLQDHSLFELASLSKPFTALGVLQLAQQGAVNVEDEVERWIPGFPYQGVTIHHLLTHTSGLPDYMEWFHKYWDHSRIAVNQDIVDMLMNHQPPGYFAPGEGWLYSNTGYVLLAVIIEKASGLSFPDFMKKNIFGPVNMQSTRVYNRRLQPETIDDYAFGYVYDIHKGQYILPDELEETEYVYYLDGIQGDGTVNSTIRDLYVFDQALYTDSLIIQASKELAFSPVRLKNGETVDYGCGWLLQNSPEKGRIVSHSGGWPGYSTKMIRYIDQQKTFIYLSNVEQNDEYEQAIFEAVDNILFDQAYVIPERPADKKKKEIDPAIYSRYIGSYSFPDGTIAYVTVENERLYIQITGQARFEIFPSSDTRFFLRSLSVEIEFILEGGTVTRFTIYQNGAVEEVMRIFEE
ncbi:serine hydrolase [Bacillus sonorensis]|uniref:Penicillin-binding protein 4 n=2 Tax=Bacillus sonorensis TaxID=119858 RepID=M5P234_9BACI|nr:MULTISPECIES: serine hydrolase [Bacillus]TWK75976.1 Penicillin-binding protein 4* [Bacillus paralicheniformis]ASB90899.1 Serine-type D-Ala-D-Ala carboxypeptidase [Bacillus sonorensis]EME74131.1 penicillin-binding protein 4 [Bacillus sonorensis L12]MCY8087663.1 serine hydrolase [Bacillus sonorensis]MCY8562945.1 serine hydrolase [Bacillus sonorensis]